MLNLLDSSTGMEITATQIMAKLKAVCPPLQCMRGFNFHIRRSFLDDYYIIHDLQTLKVY